MLNEIDRDFYCSGNNFDPDEDDSADGKRAKGLCRVNFNENGCFPCNREKCEYGCFHRKHPTPEQFKEECGYEYPDDWAVYALHEGYMGGGWDAVMGYGDAKHLAEVNPNLKFFFVCACTPFGKPGNDWRPE